MPLPFCLYNILLIQWKNEYVQFRYFYHQLINFTHFQSRAWSKDQHY